MGVRNQRDITSPAYTVTNHNIDRALDADSTTTGELADIIGTLIKDLIDQGAISGSVS